MDNIIEPATYLRYLLVLAFVLALIWGLAWLLKRFLRYDLGLGMRPKHEKLHIEEVLSIDGRSKLVRFQYEGQDHVLVIGQNYALKLIPAVSVISDTSPEASTADYSIGEDLDSPVQHPTTLAAALHARQEPSKGS